MGAWKNGAGERLEKDFGDGSVGRFATVSAAVEDSAGNLVVGTQGAGIVLVCSRTALGQHITTDNGLSHNIVLSLSLDREGNLWAGTDGGGLDRIKRKLFFAPPGFRLKPRSGHRRRTWRADCGWRSTATASPIG